MTAAGNTQSSQRKSKASQKNTAQQQENTAQQHSEIVDTAEALPEAEAVDMEVSAAQTEPPGGSSAGSVTSPGQTTAVALDPVIAAMPYEQARGELIEVVKQLENAQAPLEDTMQLWERGEALAARCQQILDAAQAKLAERQSQ